MSAPQRKREARALRIFRAVLRQNELDAVPQRDLRRETGRLGWFSTTSLASFDLIPREKEYPERWVEMEIELRGEPGLRVSPLIFVNHGYGFSIGTRIRLPAPVRDRVSALVRLPQPVVGLRFTPLDRPGRFDLGSVRVRQVSSPEVALRLGYPRAAALVREPKRLARTLRNAYLLWRTEGLLGLKRRLAGETETPLRNTTRGYADWIQCYDTLSDAERAAIKNHLHTLEYQPTISIILPLHDSNEQSLRRTLESAQSQLYPKWQLCMAGDLSNEKQVGKLIELYRSNDERIHVVYGSQTLDRSARLQNALELARGELLLVLDETDLLREHSLYMFASELNAEPEAQLVYADEDSINPAGERSNPRFKPDWNPDLLCSFNYISRFVAIRTDLVKSVGGFRSGIAGQEELDLLLLFTSTLDSPKIRHIPHLLGHTTPKELARATATAASPEQVVQEQLQKRDPRIRVEAGRLPDSCHVRYPIPDASPLVSLLIPTRDGLPLLRRCIESITQRTTYPSYEIVVVDNQSRDLALLRYLEGLAQSKKARVIKYDRPFNYSAINNLAAREAKGRILGLLNNDLEVISPHWLQEMVSQALRPEVGAVGAKLYYPDGTVQHAGVVLGIYGLSEHIHRGLGRDEPGYCGRAQLIQDISVVTAACMLLRRELFEQLHGLEEGLPVAFNDVDLCLRLQDLGYRNVFTPYAELYHYESATRGLDDSPSKRQRLRMDSQFRQRRWGARVEEDPFYSPNLTIEGTDCSRAFPPRIQRPWSPFMSLEVR